MSHHCDERPATVAELVAALGALDQTLPVYETWDEVAGWFEVADDVLWLGTRKCGTGLFGECRNH